MCSLLASSAPVSQPTLSSWPFASPTCLRRLFAEGAFSQAFVPILAEYKNRRTVEETRELINHVATLLSIVLFLVTLIGVVAAPWIIYVSAPGFAASPEKFALTIELLRITFPYILFISLVSLAGGILNTLRQIFGTGVNAGIAESLLHRLLDLACAPDRPTGNGARMGSIYRRRAPACLPGTVSHAHPITAATPPQISRYRCMARHQANGSGRVRRIDRTDQLTDQYDICLVSYHGQRVLALLCRSPDGISRRPARRCAGDDIATLAFPALCRQQHRRIFAPAGLGLAPDHAANAAGGASIGDTCHTAHHHAVLPWRIFGQRRVDDAAMHWSPTAWDCWGSSW